jgi:FkbM family methyltransferase
MLARARPAHTAYWNEFGSIRWAFGWSAAKWVRFQRWRERVFQWREPYRVQTREAEHPLWIRPGTSDLDAFRQVFLEREYAALGDESDVDLVIDCGANVGYTSAWFLSRYPSCRLIAVEPDAGNFALLSRNLAPYGDRARLVRAGLWSRKCGLKISEVPFRDGREWSVQVREASAGETPDLTAVDLGSLLAEGVGSLWRAPSGSHGESFSAKDSRPTDAASSDAESGATRISILKIDIEGAERFVFAENYEPWIDKFNALAIELHDDECRRVFAEAIRGQPLAVSQSGELTICQRLK